MPEAENIFIRVLRIALVAIVLLAALPVYFILLLQFSGFVEKSDPMSKYLRAQNITAKTYAELSEIDNIYLKLPEGVEVVELYRYFDGWRSEYVSVYLDVPEDIKEEFVQGLEARAIKDISEESVNSAGVSSGEAGRVSISYIIHNGYHDFGEMEAVKSYKAVYVVFSIVYGLGVIGLILLLMLAGRKHKP